MVVEEERRVIFAWILVLFVYVCACKSVVRGWKRDACGVGHTIIMFDEVVVGGGQQEIHKSTRPRGTFPCLAKYSVLLLLPRS